MISIPDTALPVTGIQVVSSALVALSQSSFTVWLGGPQPAQGRPETIHMLTAGLALQDLAAGVAENLQLQLRYITASLHAALTQAGDPAPAAARCAQVR